MFIHIVYDDGTCDRLLRSVGALTPVAIRYQCSIMMMARQLAVIVAAAMPTVRAVSVRASATTVIQLTYPNNVAESMAFDPNNNRLVLGSLGAGRIVGLPIPTSDETIPLDITASTAHVYFPGSDDVFSTAGLQLDADNSCLMHAAVGAFPPRTSASGVMMGVATVNLCTDSLEMFTNLTELAVDRRGMANDLVQAGSALWITDYFGGQVIRVTGHGTPLVRAVTGKPWRGHNPILS